MIEGKDILTLGESNDVEYVLEKDRICLHSSWLAFEFVELLFSFAFVDIIPLLHDNLM